MLQVKSIVYVTMKFNIKGYFMVMVVFYMRISAAASARVGTNGDTRALAKKIFFF